MSDWDKCAGVVDPDKLIGLPCYLGVDLSQTTDLCSLAAVWVDGEQFYVKAWNYAPEIGAGIRLRRDGVPYVKWAEAGWLTLTPGDTTDYAFIAKQIKDLYSKHRIRLVAYDPYNAQNLGNELEHEGMRVARVPQSYLSLSTPTRMFERAVAGGKFTHDGGPVLTWAMSNCVVERDANQNPRPSKRRSVERIDPIVATVIAIAASLHDETPPESPYESRGLLCL
jgi:phage terminase large subunit-like protein